MHGLAPEQHRYLFHELGNSYSHRGYEPIRGDDNTEQDNMIFSERFVDVPFLWISCSAKGRFQVTYDHSDALFQLSDKTVSKILTSLSKCKSYNKLQSILCKNNFSFPWLDHSFILKSSVDLVTCVTIQTIFFNFEIKLCLKYSLLYQNVSLTTNFSQIPFKNNFGILWSDHSFILK